MENNKRQCMVKQKKQESGYKDESGTGREKGLYEQLRGAELGGTGQFACENNKCGVRVELRVAPHR